MSVMGTIEIRGITYHAYHGVLPEEQRDGRRYVVDVALTLPIGAAASSDQLEDTLDYRRVADVVLAVGTGPRINLLERLATLTAEALLELAPHSTVTVKVEKVAPGLPGHPHGVSISVTRPGVG